MPHRSFDFPRDLALNAIVIGRGAVHGITSIPTCHQAARYRDQPTLSFEALENRLLLAILTVTNVADAGEGSLREAVAIANAMAGPDTINFDPALAGGTIRLT